MKQFCEVARKEGKSNDYYERLYKNHPECDNSSECYDEELDIAYVFASVYRDYANYTMKNAMEWMEKHDKKGFYEYLYALSDSEWLLKYIEEECGVSFTAATNIGMQKEWGEKKHEVLKKIKSAEEIEAIIDQYDEDECFKIDEWENNLADENYEIIDYKSDNDFTISIGGDWQTPMMIRLVGYGEEVKNVLIEMTNYDKKIKDKKVTQMFKR